MYALYAWGNFFNHESGFDRHPGWLDPAVLSGERTVFDENLTILDNGPLPVDGPGTLFEVGDEQVAGRELTGRDLGGAGWSVAHIRVATDGTLEDALRITGELEETGEIFADEAPERNPLGFGEIVTTWEDDHGQWDLALIRL
ncbi:hypothetical protein Aph02nite_31000 [Actinoplanes philippinensis]|nr:hypothetical protein [Actinoplanes philippinensis]GIE77150.1 hypothetical protein Aph02nite_31000 [Actinoplanes philippinensis]